MKKKWHFFLAGVCLFAFIACKNAAKQDSTITVVDYHTQSNYNEIQFDHLNLNVSVDFEQQQLAGYAEWRIQNPQKANELKLDTYDLGIDSVWVDGQKKTYSLGITDKELGTVLSIPIAPESKWVRIFYKTGKNATALQWLTPAQTADKKAPFLYTQSESIYARSWIPTPDGPGIRFTYDAQVQVPKGMRAVMSANGDTVLSEDGVYHFNMDIPIPAYLLALAVGDIEFRSLGSRSGVFAEKSMIEKAAYEFADMEKMMGIAESLYGPYRWGRYDMIVLPPGFPIGGMENPKMNFITPTIISGDKSLFNLVAHELAHSWSGNLVTNATWEDFWLNEGFTVYFERRITEEMFDASYVDMLWELAYQDLQLTLEDMKDSPHDTRLKLDLKGRNPDVGLTDIAYEKGALFIKMLENALGRSAIDDFLKQYFDHFAFKTIHTKAFEDYLFQTLLNQDSTIYHQLNIHDWLYTEGLPHNTPRVDLKRFNAVDAIRHEWMSGKPLPNQVTQQWSTYEWVHFIRFIPDTMGANALAALDKTYKFSQSGNSEIAAAWYLIAIRNHYEGAYGYMEHFLSTVGRRKFIVPIYSELVKKGASMRAKEWYNQFRANYHPLAQQTLDEIIFNN